MRKKAQITFVIILAIIILLAFAFIFFMRSTKETSETLETSGKMPLEITSIETFADSCLKTAGEKALWKIGAQGGYINLVNVPSIAFQGKKVPYFLQGGAAHYPSMIDLEKGITKNVIFEFQKCFDLSTFKKMGFELIEKEFPSAEVIIGKELVVIKLTYPLTIKKMGFETKLQQKVVNLPIRLGALYDSAIKLIHNIKNNQPYDITPYCHLYDTNKKTNIYFKDNAVIQLMDYSTYEHKYFQTYIFQFAVQNVAVSGGCFE